ncbi:hypothetical protein ACRW9N_10815 [Listeria aquatica]
MEHSMNELRLSALQSHRSLNPFKKRIYQEMVWTDFQIYKEESRGLQRYLDQMEGQIQ